MSGCARCAEALTDLDAALVPVVAELAVLAASPLPPVPADLEDALRARLAAEAVPAAAAPAPAPRLLPAGDGPGDGLPTGDVLPADVVPLRPRTSRSGARGPGALGVAAGVVGLLVVAGLAVGLLRGTGGTARDDTAGASVAAAPAAPDVPALATGTDYRTSADVARTLPLLLGGSASGGTAAGAAADSAADGPAGSSDSPAGSAGGTADSAAGSAGGSTGGTAGGGAAGSAAAPEAARAAAPDPLARLRDPAELAGCLSGLTDADSPGVPLALDYASFAGQPALLVVLPSAREGKVDVFAVGAGCRAGDDRTLLFSRLDRP